MALELLRNIEVQECQSEEYDFFLFSHLDLPRGEHVYTQYNISSKNYICFSKSTLIVPDELVFYADAEDFIEFFKKYEDSNFSQIKILVDISCMSRHLMSYIFAFLLFKRKTNRLHVDVVYSLGKYFPPSNLSLVNEKIDIVHPLFSGWESVYNKGTSLVTGLGYEPDRAEGASEYFDPMEQWVFMPVSPIEDFYRDVEKNNSGYLKRLWADHHVIKYDLADPESTFGQLELVVSALLERSCPVLLPFGPKLFFYLALVQGYTHQELGVWQISEGINSENYLQEPSGFVIGCRCVFSLATQ